MNFNFYYFNAIQLIFLIFYLVYYGKLKPISGLIQSFLSGFLGGFIILLFAPFLIKFVDYKQDILVAFFKAAFIEKGISFLLIYVFAYTFERKIDVNKIVVSGVQYAAGFAFLENLIYLTHFDPKVTYLRLISSVPMHLATCGIQSYYIGKIFFYSLKRFKFYNLVSAFVVPILLHGFYDYLTFEKQEYYFYFIGPIIVFIVFIFEIIYSKIQNYPNLEVLKKENIRFEDWITLQKQNAHRQWILYSSGTKNLPETPFFRFQKDYVKLTISFITLVQAILYSLFPDIFINYFEVRLEYQHTLFFIMPLSFSMIFFILGSVNPEYFKNKKIAIPIILDVDILLKNKRVVQSLCYELKTYSTFLDVEEEFLEGENLLLIFHYKDKTSYPIQSKVLKYISDSNPYGYSSGIIVSIDISSKDFLVFYTNYVIFRFLKGFVFLLNLPGSDKIRQFFVKPLTIMQLERTYKKGEVIFRQGDHGKQFYLIKKGKVGFYRELEDGESIKISENSTGDIFGEMALVSDSLRSATAICLDDCTLAVAHKDHLEALIQANPEFVMDLIKNLIKIIQRKDQELDDYRRLLEEYKKLEKVFQEILKKLNS
ncbi:MAG: cyclic nucleotide-binding domain-containing protein [Leptonema sp. (in: bacteria)]